MTAAQCASTLIDRGLDPGELDAKTRLLDRVLAVLTDAPHVWWVPGRLEVFGKHTDYAGGRTLTAALPKGFIFAARRRSDDVVRVVEAESGDGVAVNGEETDAPASAWRRYVDVVVRRLNVNFPDATLGADIAFASDLPRAAGMSSSSALVVGVAEALVELSGINRMREWQCNVATPLDAASYFACIENGSRFGTLDGRSGVGTHGGSEDHATMLAARTGELTAFAFVPPRRLTSARLPRHWKFVIADSGVVAEKTGNARDAYNRLSGGVRTLLELWNAHETAAASLAPVLQSAADAADRLRAYIRRGAGQHWRPEALERRLDHFIREDRRVPSALDAVAHGDSSALGELSSESQADAEALLGNQIPETTALVSSARALGAFAACSFGAGFGGSVWALVDAADAPAFASRWHQSAFVALPAPPLTPLGSGL